MKIQLDAIKLKKLYLTIASLSPIWIAVPILLQKFGLHQYIVVLIGLLLLSLTGVIAQMIARRKIELSADDDSVVYENVRILKKDLVSIKVDKSGIGVTAIVFNLKFGKKEVLHFPNVKDNAQKGIDFIEKATPGVEFIAPVDLLDE